MKSLARPLRGLASRFLEYYKTMRRKHVVAGLLVLAVLVVIVFDMQRSVSMATITIGDTQVEVEVASTPAQHRQGLSGRTSLPAGSGMLFVFQQPNRDGFWMKDMHFSLDIIWADSAGAITTIAHGISPSTYPQSFHPVSPALSVLEVPAGFAKAHGIVVGDKIVVQ